MNESMPTTKYDDDHILRVACATPLPTSASSPPVKRCPAKESTTISNDEESYLPGSQSAPSSPPKFLPKPPKRLQRKRPPPFNVFIDGAASRPSSKKTPNPRKDGRMPLGMKQDSGNSTPSPSPRDYSTPLSFNQADPLWMGFENFAPPTPPATPALPPLPPPPSPRRLRPRRHESAPRTMVLYDLLELSDRTASSKAIKAAYKRVALKNHPDKASPEETEAAHARMLKINAARDVLLDVRSRKKYDKDGKLPWATMTNERGGDVDE